MINIHMDDHSCGVLRPKMDEMVIHPSIYLHPHPSTTEEQQSNGRKRDDGSGVYWTDDF